MKISSKSYIGLLSVSLGMVIIGVTVRQNGRVIVHQQDNENTKYWVACFYKGSGQINPAQPPVSFPSTRVSGTHAYQQAMTKARTYVTQTGEIQNKRSIAVVKKDVVPECANYFRDNTGERIITLIYSPIRGMNTYDSKKKEDIPED
ncbi:hypothetical protein H6G33_10495 [Calothrix sp. FACHB-1219]|uniref:hypothetical protein n=1 Tax=unclassified Calothrix TaxID=2619626 RepID=UPI00168713C2|nr:MULTISPECIES: hypothetical protein [unclassified Calothrix]MBD2201776.1 hypothetical protein [Calothrix sp. FACHB-168]MBD2217462.1 hypothetical protein [Calothrix sp. FACHB-1219]